jgi:hypothetical protein
MNLVLNGIKRCEIVGKCGIMRCIEEIKNEF